MRFLICGVLSAALTSFSYSAQQAFAQVVVGSQGLSPAAQLTIDNSGSNPNALAEIIQLIGTPTETIADDVLLLDPNGFVGSMDANTFQSRDEQGRMVHPTGQPLLFGSQTESTDSLLIKRIQIERDQSELFFGIGDNPGLGVSGEDQIVFGSTNGAFGIDRGTTAFKFTSGGALTMPAYGEGNSYFTGSSSADYVLTVSSTGFVRELPASSFSYSTSDERLKRDVQPLDVNLDALLQLEGVQYQWVDENMGSSGRRRSLPRSYSH